MRASIAAALLLSVALAAPPLCAEEPPPTAVLGEPTAETLQHLNEEAAILEVQARIAKARREIALASPAGAASSAPVGVGPLSTPPAAVAGHMPSVRVIWGSGRNLSAELALPNGATTYVKAGGIVPGFGSVAQISDQGVVLTTPQGPVALTFGGASLDAATIAAPIPLRIPMPGTAP